MTHPRHFMSVVMSTHNQPWEIDKTLYSLFRQTGMNDNEFEVIVLNTQMEDKETIRIMKKYKAEHENLRFIQVYDEKRNLITNATYGLNLGVRQFANGELLLLVVDPARVPTPGSIRKTRDEFERWGDDIVTTTIPYHFLKHYSDPNFTVEECREAFLKTRWKKNMDCLWDYAAHTNISSSGVPNESTWLGVTRKNFMKVGGHNEIFHTWSDYNLDLWRRLTRPLPKLGKQLVGDYNERWGKIGLGLDVRILQGEADFHLHHSLSDAARDFSMLKQLRIDSWNEYEDNQDCIVANLTRPDWGTGEAYEVSFQGDLMELD